MATVRNRRSRKRDAALSVPPTLSVMGVVGMEDCNVGCGSRPVSPAADVPQILARALERARKWTSPGPQGPPNSFVTSIIGLRHSFYDFGFSLTSPAGRFESWYRAQRAAVARYRQEAWLEWLRVDNLVTLWRKGGLPFRIKPEECRYSDRFGLEVLEYDHGLTQDEINALALSPGQKAELRRSPTLKLTKADDSLFGFEVLKRAATGEGLSWPGLMGVFLAMSATESLQVSDAQLASQMRNVYEQHQWGHETRYGVQAGGSANFLKKPQKDAIERAIKPVKGATRLVTRHDYKITMGAGLPDPKFFEAKRYASAREQLLEWSLPLGQMLVAKTLNPYLLQFLRYLALKERELLAPHLEAVAERCLGAPGPVKVKWGTKCFADSRLAFDMLKTGLAAGPTSQTTYLTDTDQDPEREREFKTQEFSLPDAQTQPLVVAQGAAVNDRAGRKRGSNDLKQ